jgi:hypothetical protein
MFKNDSQTSLHQLPLSPEKLEDSVRGGMVVRNSQTFQSIEEVLTTPTKPEGSMHGGMVTSFSQESIKELPTSLKKCPSILRSSLRGSRVLDEERIRSSMDMTDSQKRSDELPLSLLSPPWSSLRGSRDAHENVESLLAPPTRCAASFSLLGFFIRSISRHFRIFLASLCLESQLYLSLIPSHFRLSYPRRQDEQCSTLSEHRGACIILFQSIEA